MTLPSAAELRPWTPVHVRAFDAPILVEWARLGANPVPDPFFAQTVMRAMQRPFNLAFRRTTPIEAVERFAEGDEAVPLRGIIYHMSRSGSTLISRMLNALPRSLVVSEPAPLSQILQLAVRGVPVDEERHVRLVRGMVKALLRARRPEERDGFVKVATTDVLHAPLLQRAFPGVRSIFAFRHPLEVLASQAKVYGSDVLPGQLPLDVLEVAPTDAASLTIEEWIARAIAAVCRAALRLDECTFVDYASLPDAAVSLVPEVFGLHYDDDERARMLAAAAVDAKAPDHRFTPDAQEKRRSASAAVRAAAELLMPLYGELRSRAASASSWAGVNATESRK
ncbi:MAG TPA: sulfotransferase [Candidatus Limnocylindria bacterium]|nr:sulfotransferase [Candidatus Limnocylindria bacterium]